MGLGGRTQWFLAAKWWDDNEHQQVYVELWNVGANQHRQPAQTPFSDCLGWRSAPAGCEDRRDRIMQLMWCILSYCCTTCSRAEGLGVSRGYERSMVLSKNKRYSSVSIYIYKIIYMHTHICAYVYLCVYIYACIHIYMNMCQCIYI